MSQGSKDAWFVGCSQWRVKLNSKNIKESHFFHRLKDEIDHLFLKRLFEGESVSILKYTYIIDS